MLRKFRWLVLGIALACGSAAARQVAGVEFAEAQTVAGADLQLNGAGLRTKFLFKVYAAGLYVGHRSTDPLVLLQTREPWRMRLHMLRDLDADSLVNAFREGLEANLGAADRAALAGSIEQFATLMRGIGRAKAGDEVSLDYAQDRLTVAFAGEPRGVVSDARFGRALLSIWLGEHPVDGELKKNLLGG